MRNDRLPLWSGIAASILFLLLIGLFLHVRSENEAMRAELSDTAAALERAITESESRAGQAIATAKEEASADAAAIRGELAQLNVDTSRRLNVLEGKLGAVQEESQALREEIVRLNVKSQDFSAIIDDTLESVVSITTDQGIGSGVIVDDEGYVVTNAHVLEGATAAVAKGGKGGTWGMSLVATDRTADLALVKLRGSGDFASLPFARRSDIRTGMKVIALGSPLGLEFTVTEGIVSSADRTNEAGVAVVQVDVPINPGNSGGPVVDIQGRIIGISTYKARDSEGLGFAVRADVVEEFVEDALAEVAAQQAQQG